MEKIKRAFEEYWSEKKWQDLTEEQMDSFITKVISKLNIDTWSGCDIADIYEYAFTVSKPESTIQTQRQSGYIKESER